MLVTDKIEHLCKRGSRYYFRFKFPCRVPGADIRLSLKTSELDIALYKLKLILPSISLLKALMPISGYYDDKDIEKILGSIRYEMKRKLTLNDIDGIIAESESNSSNVFHGFNILGDVHLSDLPSDVLTFVADVLMTEDHAERRRKMSLYAAQSEEFESAMAWAFRSLNVVSEADERANTDHSNTIVSSLLDDLGYEYSPNSMAFKVLSKRLATSRDIKRKLANAIVQEDAIAERKLETLLKTKPSVSNQMHVAPVAAPASQAPLFSEVYQEFLRHKIHKENLTPRMQSGYERNYKIWTALSEDKPIDQYEPRDIGIFIDRCFELPKMNKAPYSSMSWQERLNTDVKEEDVVAPKTVSQYYKWLQGVFAYAKRDTVGYIKSSPCTIRRDFKQRKRGSFTDAEIKVFLHYLDSVEEMWRKWVLLLAIYTGARRTELYQLRIDDVKTDESTGIHYFLITDEHDTQRLKSENARRKIPVHQDLLDLGLMEHLKTCNDRILDGLDNPETITRWFGTLLEKLAISSVGEMGEVRSFHSFRHTAITKLRMEGSFDLALIQQLVGHELSKAGITDNYTHGVVPIRRLKQVIDGLDFG